VGFLTVSMGVDAFACVCPGHRGTRGISGGTATGILLAPHASSGRGGGPAKRLRVSAGCPSCVATFRLRFCVFAFRVAVDRSRGDIPDHRLTTIQGDRRMLNLKLAVCALAATVLTSAYATTTDHPDSAVMLQGKGAQIYACTKVSDAYTWKLKAPDAGLYDAAGNEVGKHFAGPTWQSSDGSKVVAEAVSASPSPDAHAVAWLVLRAKDHVGVGSMAAVDYIVRANTTGGAAPKDGCDEAHANAEIRVPYTAAYLFFRH
jgi:hypothetical protein